jgi:hypothetical protein
LICALSVAIQLDATADLEWWMHYNIPSYDGHYHFENDVEKKESGVRTSSAFPDETPGTGLFTKTARKAKDFIVSFPGYWMESHVYSEEDGSYGFTLPTDRDWGPMNDLIYVTHGGCQANFINAAVVGTEVHRMRALRVLPWCIH